MVFLKRAHAWTHGNGDSKRNPENECKVSAEKGPGVQVFASPSVLLYPLQWPGSPPLVILPASGPAQCLLHPSKVFSFRVSPCSGVYTGCVRPSPVSLTEFLLYAHLSPVTLLRATFLPHSTEAGKQALNEWMMFRWGEESTWRHTQPRSSRFPAWPTTTWLEEQCSSAARQLSSEQECGSLLRNPSSAFC